MALQFQTFEFDLAAPLDESLETAARAVALSKCENGAYDKQGGIHKRPGLLAKTATTTLTNVRRLIPHVDDVCAVGTSSAESAFAQFSAAKADWIRQDSISEAVITRRPVVRDESESYQDADMAVGLKWIAYIYVRQRTGPAYDTYIRVTDRETGTVLSDALVATNCRGVRAVATPDQTSIVLTYVDTGASILYGHVVDADGDGSLTGPTTIDTSCKSTIYDLICNGNTLVYYVGITVADDIRVAGRNVPALTSATSFDIVGTYRRPSACFHSSGDLVIAAWNAFATTFDIVRRTITGTLVTGPTTLDGTGTEFLSQAGLFHPTAGAVFVTWAFDNIDGAGTDAIKFRTWDATTAALGTTTLLYRYRLASRIFADSTSGKQRIYQWLWDESASTLVLNAWNIPSLEWRPVASSAFDAARVPADNLKSISPGDTGTYRSAAMVAILPQEALAAVDDLEVDFQDPDLFSAARFGPTTYIAGGVLQQITGHQVHEHAFLQIPHFTVTDTAGANLTAGKAYTYAVAYEYIDEYGLFHIGAPEFVTFTAVSGSAALSIHPLTMTRRMTASRMRPKVMLGVYRSVGNIPDVLYRLYTIDSTPDTLENDPTVVAAIAFTDTIGDAAHTTHRQLYTNGQAGSQLDRDALWGGCRGLCAHKSRLFAWGGEDRERVWYSQESIAGEPPEFSLAQYIRVPGETVVACASLDDALIIFTDRGLHAVFGDGPAPTGDTASGSFSTPVPIASDTGCVSGQVGVTKRGAYFRGPQGIYLCDRGRNIIYIGAHVEDTVAAAGTLLAITRAESRGEVRFTFAGVTCVYNELVDRWSTFKYGLNAPAVEGALALNGAHYTAVTGDLYVDTEATHADDNLGTAGADFAPALSIRTTELDFGTGQEAKRCRRIRAIVRDDPDGSTHSGLQLQIYVDGALGPTDQLTFTQTDVAAEYDSLPIGLPKLGFRWKPVHQRFQRISVVLQEVNAVAPGMTFLGLAFEVGSKGSMRRAAVTASK